MSILTLIRSVPAGAKRFVREVRKEYKARQIDAAVRALEREERMYMQMSEAERLQLDADNAEILRRSYELKQARKAKNEARGYYARRERAERKVRNIMGEDV